MPDIQRPQIHQPINELAFLEDLHIKAMYTDGSWSIKNTLSTLLLGNGAVDTAGAIAVLTSRGTILIKIKMDIACGSAYETEVMSLLIAHSIAKGRKLTIWSDCEAAMKRLNGRHLGSLAQALKGWKRDPNIVFKKVKAHPETRLPPDL